jgi:hypothetical protein
LAGILPACGFFCACGSVSSLKMFFRFLGMFMGLLWLLQKMACIFPVLLEMGLIFGSMLAVESNF